MRVLALVVCVLVLSACAERDPRVGLDIHDDGGGAIAFELATENMLTDAPLLLGMDYLRNQLRASNIESDVVTIRRNGTQRLSLRMLFRSSADLQRLLRADALSLPPGVTSLLPPEVADAVPTSFNLANAQLNVIAAPNAGRIYTLDATLEPQIQRALRAAGVTLSVRMPGTIVETNGVVTGDEIVWPGPEGWTANLHARSELGVVGRLGRSPWVWGILAVVAVGVVALVVVRRARRRRQWSDTYDETYYPDDTL